ncbi:MAG: hypothetical protein KGR98_02130, partial [Verrucomicrobia bacterium]|nr:hypothetical protein [Verrucomicrobiota bacterium]
MNEMSDGKSKNKCVDGQSRVRSRPGFIILLAVAAGVVAAGGASLAADMHPMLAVLKGFERAPATGPGEAPMPARAIPNPAKTHWPGGGLARHPMLFYGEGNNVLYVVNGGKVVWSYAFPKGGEIDDAWMMSNGHILLTKMLECYEVTPDKRIVWTYKCPPGAQIHACQPIGPDKVMIVQNGLPPHMIILNKKDNSIVMEHVLPAISATNPKTVHTQYRNCRVTGQGSYLI